MPVQLEVEYHPEALPDTSVLHLRGTASFREAPELRRRLFHALGEHRTDRLVVELAEVEKMDTAAMAVLVEGMISSREDGPELFFCTPSDSVRKVFRLSGLEEALSRCYGCLGDLPDAGAG
jgi:anti-anti-sigma factor